VNLLTAQGVDYEFFGEAAPWFQWFIISDSETSVEVLTASHANLNIRGAGGVTLLHLACMWGSGDIIRSLVNSGANLNAHTVSGWTMLHSAASNKSEEPLEYLLACGLEPNISDDDMTTPLHLAAANGSDEHLQMLLAAGANVSVLDSGNCLALHYAMSNWRILNRTEVLDALAKYDVDVNISACDGLSPLHIASKHGSPLLFQWLLNRGANLQAVDHEGRTVLHAAAANDKDMRGVILRALLDKGIDPNVVDESGMSPLHNVFFWQNGRFELNLQQEGFTRERRQRTLHTTKEYKTKLQLLLEYGAFINLQDNRGNTVLHWASSSSNGPAVRLLLDRGARKDLMDLEGCKPSDAAKSDKIRLLLETS
jgi:ankyrin repeat protein